MIERNPGDLLFVYGLLRKGAPHEMAQLLEQEANYISSGKIRGLLYLVSYYPGIVLQKDVGWVIGDIYKIDSMDLWNRLDKFEGLPGEDEYRLVKCIAVTKCELLDCFTYEFNKDTYGMQTITSGDFLQHLNDKSK